ncbi:hypothetical protein GGI21_005004 [Coemansia aciculifera]|nr:hypothetical protein GGI21_005004 [Coemansia aciculifera]
MLSPVKESSSHDDSGAPSSSAKEYSPPCAHEAYGLSTIQPTTVATARLPRTDYGTCDSASNARANVFAAGSSRCQSPTNVQLSNYRIDALVAGSGRVYRSSSLDPTMLSSMPSSYPSLSGDASGSASSEVSDKA